MWQAQQLRVDLATTKRSASERLHKLNDALARLEIAEAKLELLEAEKTAGSG